MTGTEQGINSVIFTAQFGAIWMASVLVGILFSFVCRLGRKYGVLPKAPKDSAYFVMFGVALTVAPSGIIIGWINVVALMLLFVASGIPMMVDATIANIEAKHAQAKEAAHDAAKEMAGKCGMGTNG